MKPPISYGKEVMFRGTDANSLPRGADRSFTGTPSYQRRLETRSSADRLDESSYEGQDSARRKVLKVREGYDGDLHALPVMAARSPW